MADERDPAGDNAPPSVRNTANAERGNTVQAGIVNGDVHFHPMDPRILVILAAVLVLTLVLVLVLLWPSHSDPNANPPPPSPSRTPTTTSQAQPTTTTTPPPSTTTTPAQVAVFFSGSLELDGDGGPGGGWWLDDNPPRSTFTGDLFYGSDNEIAASTALVAWDSSTPPTEAQCASQLDTHLGIHVMQVVRGSMACLRTWEGRVGYVIVTSTSGTYDLSPVISVQATVWNKPA